MGKTSNTAKQQWNDAHYIQIKVSVNPEIATAFKTSCIDNGVSMASILSQFMSEYSNLSQTILTKKIVHDFTSTRGKRRQSIKTLIQKLELIRDAEEQYLDNIPENLKSSMRFDAADESVSILNEVIELLETAY